MALQWQQINPNFQGTNTAMRNAVDAVNSGASIFANIRDSVYKREQDDFENRMRMLTFDRASQQYEQNRADTQARHEDMMKWRHNDTKAKQAKGAGSVNTNLIKIQREREFADFIAKTVKDPEISSVTDVRQRNAMLYQRALENGFGDVSSIKQFDVGAEAQDKANTAAINKQKDAAKIFAENVEKPFFTRADNFSNSGDEERAQFLRTIPQTLEKLGIGTKEVANLLRDMSVEKLKVQLDELNNDTPSSNNFIFATKFATGSKGAELKQRMENLLADRAKKSTQEMTPSDYWNTAQDSQDKYLANLQSARQDVIRKANSYGFNIKEVNADSINKLANTLLDISYKNLPKEILPQPNEPLDAFNARLASLVKLNKIPKEQQKAFQDFQELYRLQALFDSSVNSYGNAVANSNRGLETNFESGFNYPFTGYNPVNPENNIFDRTVQGLQGVANILPFRRFPSNNTFD